LFTNSQVAGSWPELVDRLERCGTWARWALVEPALLMVGGPSGLPAALARGVDRDSADALLGALIRLAAADGGDEQDAVLVVLHALADGAAALARQVAHRTADSLSVVVGELTCQIRAFPWRRRTRAYAANLLADTKHQLWVGELRPLGTGHHPEQARPVDPLTWPGLRLDRAAPVDPAGQSQAELLDLLVWAAGAGVAPVIWSCCGTGSPGRGPPVRRSSRPTWVWTSGRCGAAAAARSSRCATAVRTIWPRWREHLACVGPSG